MSQGKSNKQEESAAKLFIWAAIGLFVLVVIILIIT